MTNVTAGPVTDIGRTKELLKVQVSSSVRWQQSMEYMLANGVDTFVEIGPRQTLAGFLKKNRQKRGCIQCELPGGCGQSRGSSGIGGTHDGEKGSGCDRSIPRIGRAVALELAARGNLVIINYNGSAERAEEVKKEIEAAGGEAAVYQCDVSQYGECEAFIKQVIKDYGRLDILVNNAGITRDGC